MNHMAYANRFADLILELTNPSLRRQQKELLEMQARHIVLDYFNKTKENHDSDEY